MARRLIGYQVRDAGVGILNYTARDDWSETEPCPPPPPAAPGPDRPKGAGNLGFLPVEMLMEVLLWLDVESLRTMRHVSVELETIIEQNLVELHALEKHAFETLRVMEGTGTLSVVSVRALYAEFCYPWCRICGNFGPYLFLPTFIRCCDSCHHDSSLLDVIPTAAAEGVYALQRQMLEKHLTVVQTFPKRYRRRRGCAERPCYRLVSMRSAERLAMEIHGSLDTIRNASSKLEHKSWLKAKGIKPNDREYKNRQQNLDIIAPHCFVCARTVPRGLYLHRHSDRFLNKDPSDWVFMATVAFPHWGRKFERVEEGVHCLYCKMLNLIDFATAETEMYLIERRSRSYRLQDFAEHCKNCLAAVVIEPTLGDTWAPYTGQKWKYFEILQPQGSAENKLVVRWEDATIDYPL